MDKNPKFITAYGPHLSVDLVCDDPSLTKQSFAAECDINNIMAKYETTGLLDFVNEHQPRYGDVRGIDFQSAMDKVAEGTEIFSQMPAKLREEFQNDPGQFFDFINDPANLDRAVEMGLMALPVAEATPLPAVAAASNPGDSVPAVVPVRP